MRFVFVVLSGDHPVLGVVPEQERSPFFALKVEAVGLHLHEGSASLGSFTHTRPPPVADATASTSSCGNAYSITPPLPCPVTRRDATPRPRQRVPVHSHKRNLGQARVHMVQPLTPWVQLVGATFGVDVERLVPPPGVIVGEHGVGTGHNAGRAPRCTVPEVTTSVNSSAQCGFWGAWPYPIEMGLWAGAQWPARPPDRPTADRSPARPPSGPTALRATPPGPDARRPRPAGRVGYPRPVPELPEVENYRRFAEGALGRTVARVSAPDSWFIKGGTDGPALRRALTGHRLTAARRIGKLMLLDLEGLPTWASGSG